ncbi:MAG: hypothetical protein QM673_13975, partial [Gordonia sp. (in: high G+C Gram-positive bacteria)]
VGLLVVAPWSSADDDEVRLLGTLRARFGTVALVCTRIDAFWEWPRILRAQRALLDPYEQVPVFAVATAAAIGGAIDESGVGDLLDWLAEARTAPLQTRVTRARIAASGSALEHALDQAASTDVDVMAAEVHSLDARRRMLLAGRDRGRADRMTAVRVGVARARTQTAADIHSGIRALATSVAARVAELTRAGRAEHAQWLDAEIGALAARIDVLTGERLEEVAAAALVGLGGRDLADGADLGDGVDVSAPAPSGERIGVRRAPPTGARIGEDALVMMIGASTGLGVGRLVVAPMAAVSTLQWFSMPLTLLFGLAVATWVIRVRRASSVRTEMRGWGTEVLSEARGRLEHRLGLRAGEAESKIGGQITRYYERRGRLTVAQVSAIDERIRQLRSASAGAHAAERAARERREQLERLRRDVARRATQLWPQRGGDSTTIDR